MRAFPGKALSPRRFVVCYRECTSPSAPPPLISPRCLMRSVLPPGPPALRTCAWAAAAPWALSFLNAPPPLPPSLSPDREAEPAAAGPTRPRGGICIDLKVVGLALPAPAVPLRNCMLMGARLSVPTRARGAQGPSPPDPRPRSVPQKWPSPSLECSPPHSNWRTPSSPRHSFAAHFSPPHTEHAPLPSTAYLQPSILQSVSSQSATPTRGGSRREAQSPFPLPPSHHAPLLRLPPIRSFDVPIAAWAQHAWGPHGLSPPSPSPLTPPFGERASPGDADVAMASA